MQAQTKKIVIASSIIGAIIITVVIILRTRRKKLEGLINSGSADVINNANTTTTSILFPLKQGSGKTTAEKNAVKVVQRYLNAKRIVNSWLNISALKEDGLFGPLTEDALYKLATVTEVSYTLYKQMQAYLSTPDLLRIDAPAYTGK
jgi:hypothetical protein